MRSKILTILFALLFALSITGAAEAGSRKAAGGTSTTHPTGKHKKQKKQKKHNKGTKKHHKNKKHKKRATTKKHSRQL